MAIQGLITKMKKDLRRYAESPQAKPSVVQAKEFVINEIEKYVESSEIWIEQIEFDQLVLNQNHDLQIAKLQERIWVLEAICIIHGITDFPMWAVKDPAYLLHIAGDMEKNSMATLPFKFKNNIIFRRKIYGNGDN